jgi:hypothetical protein
MYLICKDVGDPEDLGKVRDPEIIYRKDTSIESFAKFP